MKVTSVKASFSEDGVSSKVKKGTCLIDLTEIQHAFEADNEEIELVMRSGDRFFVKNLTLVELEQLIDRIL